MRLRISHHSGNRLPVLSVLFILLLFQSNNLFPQGGMWTWMKGTNTILSPGIYGTQGVSDPANNPPSVYEPCEWTDHNGNFWMLGGDGYNCLWKFDQLTTEWTWMRGSITGLFGTYGVQGIPSPSNDPGGRSAATTWVDNDGFLWLFGGYGYASSGLPGGLNDLWKYDIGNNEWTWVGGLSTTNGIGIYGTQGVPDPGNIPGGRLESAAAWVDSLNNLWFFGGQLCCNASGYINDVWKYDQSSGQWTWMKGSTVSGALGTYGTKGIPDTANTPGGRRIYSHWKHTDGTFWLCGGQDNFQNCFNDLWKYDPVTNDWTWVNGSNVFNAIGNFGTQCLFDSTSVPGSRMENRFYWTDSCNNFWMFGGLNTGNGLYRNDLWCYNPTLNLWKWVSGSSSPNQFGSYGTQGVPDVSNHPGARYGGVGWIGKGESIWLYGGIGFPFNNNTGKLGDLWRFVPDSSCVYCNLMNLPASALQSSDTSVCEKFCIDFFDLSSNNPTSWHWEFTGGIPDSSLDQNPANICYNNPGTYDVVLITTNGYGSDTLIMQDLITVFTTPPFPVITQAGNTLTSSLAESYQWQFNNADIPGATNQSYDVQQSGYYSVYITDENGCVSSTTIYVLIDGINEINSDENVLVYPNPSNGNFMVELSNGLVGNQLQLKVYNTLGQVVFSSDEKIPGVAFKKEIGLKNIAVGVYVVKIKAGPTLINKKLIISEQPYY
jgi:hypothetical protein